MNRNIIQSILKYKILVFISLILLQITSIAQNNVSNELKNQFEKYHINNLQEKIFLHTDKTFYLVGENIWFKAYVVDGFFNKPLVLSKVLYAEIIDKDLKPALQTKIALDSAMGNGSIAIPASLVSGNYTIRAYTQWMKNYSTDFFYQQPITIVNTLKDIPLPNDSIPDKTDFQFFPEGGNLVAGLTSKIAFKATDKHGNGINCSGIILNDINDTVANFRSVLFGMGNFIIKPNKDEHYKAIIKLDNNTLITQKLPIIYNTGYVMNVMEGNDKQLNVTVNFSPDFDDSPIYFFAHSHHLIKSVQSAKPINGKVVFKIDKKELADGISHFTIFNNNKKPICERLYFKQPLSKLLISTITNKETYTTRENVQLQINTTDEIKTTFAANLSMSIFLIDSLQPATYTDILSYLLLTSDLKGKIESPSYYLNDKNADANLAVDNLMLTQGWRRFNWEDILQNKTPNFEFLPEYEGLVLNGKIVDKTTTLPSKNTTAYLSIPNKAFQFFNAISNDDGKIRYSLKKIYGNNQIITQTDGKNNYQIDFENPFSTILSTDNRSYFNLSSNLKNNLLQRHIAMQVQHTYNMEENRKFIPPNNLDTTAFYGSPTFSFNLDGFTRFNTMEEVIKEFVTDVQLRKKEGKSYFRVIDRSLQTLFDNDPLLLIDGVPIFDADKIVAFDPLKIKTIDIISSKYLYGPVIYDGIISFKTYNGDLGGYQLDPNAIALQFDALQQQREFYSPKYETETEQQSRIPDFRNVLYWEPNLKTNKTGKTSVNFYTADVAGKYAIVTQGLTANGKFGSCISTFQVK